MSFEHISEPVHRVIYSCQYAIGALEKAEALKRAKANTRAAIRHEFQLKKRAQILRGLAIGGSLRGLATFIATADQYDNAVLAREACERLERNYAP